MLDTNVIVDVLLRREPFFADSAEVLDRAERGAFTAWVCATTVTTIFYLVRKHIGSAATIARLEDLTSLCATAAVSHAVIATALHSPVADFEDAVLHHAALAAGAECIVTRNQADFKNSTLPIYSPAQFLKTLA